MKVKIGDTWYGSNEQPICIQVSEIEQKQIGALDRSVAKNGKYAVFPDAELTTAEEKLNWMRT